MRRASDSNPDRLRREPFKDLCPVQDTAAATRQDARGRLRTDLLRGPPMRPKSPRSPTDFALRALALLTALLAAPPGAGARDGQNARGTGKPGPRLEKDGGPDAPDRKGSEAVVYRIKSDV